MYFNYKKKKHKAANKNFYLGTKNQGSRLLVTVITPFINNMCDKTSKMSLVNRASNLNRLAHFCFHY